MSTVAKYRKSYRIYPDGLEHLICTRFWYLGGMVSEAYDPRRRITILNMVCPGCTVYDINTPRWKEMELSFIKKSLERASKAPASSKCLDNAFLKHFPALSEFMTCTSMDGAERQTSTVSAWWSPNGFTAVLNDRETGQSLFVSAASFDGLWEALETALKSSDPGWRAKDEQGRSKRVRRA